MTEENLESSQAAGSEGTTNSVASQGSGVEQSSTFDANQLLERLVPALEPLIDKKIQSLKDRRLTDFGEELKSEFSPVLERFKDLVSPEKLEQIKKDLEFEELKRRVYGEEKRTDEKSQAGNLHSLAGELAQVVAENKLNADDPKVNALLQKYKDNPLKAAVELTRYATEIASAPPPDPSASPSMTASQPATSNYSGISDEELGAKLDMLATVDPRGSMDERAKIRAELERRDKNK